MTDATIGDFTIANVDVPTFWGRRSQLDLTNLKASTLHDYFRPDQPNQGREELVAWPARVFLAGFIYKNLGIFTGESGRDILERPVNWYKEWLERNPEFSPQPYWQLAAVLRQSGYPEKADNILYAARVRERNRACDRGEIGRCMVLSMLQYTVGYGIGFRYFRVFIPIFLVAAVGFGVLLRVSRKDETRDIFTLAFASLGHVLPVALDKTHESVITAGNRPRWALLWFHIQKIAGWVLGGFLVAAFAGLTQKS